MFGKGICLYSYLNAWTTKNVNLDMDIDMFNKTRKSIGEPTSSWHSFISNIMTEFKPYRHHAFCSDRWEKWKTMKRVEGGDVSMNGAILLDWNHKKPTKESLFFYIYFRIVSLLLPWIFAFVSVFVLYITSNP